MNTKLTLLAAFGMVLAAGTSSVCMADDDPLNLGVVPMEYVVSPSPERPYSALPSEITLNVTNSLPYLNVESKTVHVYGPDGAEITNAYTVRVSMNSTGVNREYRCAIPGKYTAPGEYVIVMPEGSFTFPTQQEEVSEDSTPAPLAPNTIPYYTGGEIRFVYTVGSDNRGFTSTPAEGEVDFFQTAVIKFTGASSVTPTDGASATLSDRFGAETYPCTIAKTGTNAVTVTTVNGLVEVLGEHVLTIPAGTLVIDGVANASDMKLYYNIVGVEPVWTVNATPAFGTIESFSKIILDFGDGMEVKHPFKIDFPATLYMIDEDGTRTVVQTLVPRSEDGSYDEYTGDLVTGTSKVSFSFLPIEVPGEYELVVPRTTLSFNGKNMHSDMVFGRWIIEDKVGGTYNVDISPEPGSTVSNLGHVDFAFSGVESLTWDEWSGVPAYVYYTGDNGERTRWSYVSFTKVDDATLRVFINEYVWDPKQPGLYEVVIPAGGLTLTAADGTSFYCRAITAAYTLGEALASFEGEMNVNMGGSSYDFVVSFKPEPTSVEIYDDGQPITVKGIIGDAIAASSVKVNGGKAYVHFNSLPEIQYINLSIPANYFLVDGKTSNAVTVPFTMTGVESVIADGAEADVYTLDGVLVAKGATKDALKNLHEGVYVIGGKTVILK